MEEGLFLLTICCRNRKSEKKTELGISKSNNYLLFDKFHIEEVDIHRSLLGGNPLTEG
jgi:hypothetical protein